MTEHPKQFNKLKIIAGITTLMVAACLIFLVSKWHLYPNSEIARPVIVALSLLIMLITHSISILFFLQIFYPKTEVPKMLSTFFRWLSVLCWLTIGFLVLCVLLIFIVLSEKETVPQQRSTIIFISCITVLITGYVIQLTLSRKLISTIQANYKNSLLDNFLDPV